MFFGIAIRKASPDHIKQQPDFQKRNFYTSYDDVLITFQFNIY